MHRAAELAGVLVASVVVNTVLNLALLRSSMDLGAWAVSAAVPLGMLVVYWVWVEPRQRKVRIREARFRRALESAITRDCKLDPGHNVSRDGLLFEDAPDSYRQARYGELHIQDLFVPDPRKGEAALMAKVREGEKLLRRAKVEGLTPDLWGQLEEWERLAAEDVAFYQRGVLRTGQAAGFTKHSFTKQPDDQSRIKRVSEEISELRAYASEQANLARQQSERISGA